MCAHICMYVSVRCVYVFEQVSAHVWGEVHVHAHTRREQRSASGVFLRHFLHSFRETEFVMECEVHPPSFPD